MEQILILDFGGQYKQLIARRVRECGVYCEIHSYRMPVKEIRERAPKGIILTGGPNSVYGPGAALCEAAIFTLGIPVLGICYGAQLMAHLCGGRVSTAPVSEYGKTEVIFAGKPGDRPSPGMGREEAPSVRKNSALFQGLPERGTVWMSHTDYIASLPEGFRATAYTENCPVAAMEEASRSLYAVQFHPEVQHTAHGTDMLRRFVFDVCGCRGSWRMDDFVSSSVREIRERVGNGRALCALSGGVDSSVAAVLMSKAIGRQLTCVFVDHGLLRKNEGDEVEAVFGANGPYELNFIRVNAQARFYKALEGVEEPERKRKIIGEEFIRVFEEEAEKIGSVDFLVQGTIYPDVVESGAGEGAVIKSHHNVGGLPEHVRFKEIIEPLRMLFKDEVRQAGLALGIPEYLVYRQPFPGPGLGIRIIGEVTEQKVRIVQEADAILREELERTETAYRPGQYFAALTNLRSVGVMGDFRTYDYAVCLRAVNTSDFMTADAAEIPWETLQRCMNRIINEVKGVNRVLYDLTSKPPGTIEYE